MTTGRRIAEGVGSFLRFEHYSGRSELFSEKYLCSAIGQILSGTGFRTTPEYKHPALEKIMNGRGRRPAIDFVCRHHKPIYDDHLVQHVDNKAIRKAVESKWIGNSSPAFESIMWDIVRLCLVNRDTNADCYFVIGGRVKDIREYFSNFPELHSRSTGHRKKVFL